LRTTLIWNEYRTGELTPSLNETVIVYYPDSEIVGLMVYVGLENATKAKLGDDEIVIVS